MRVWRKDIDTAAFLVYIDKCALYYKKDREIEEVKENKLLTVLSHGMECQDVKEHGRPHQLARNFESGAYSHFLIIHVSKISWPIKTDVFPLFFSQSDYRRYAVFCMLKIGTDIYDTTMISDVDRSMTDITFEDVILL